jgi:CO/xanthine dehydrogenase FAD-binding subunit
VTGLAYHAPKSVEETVALLSDSGGDARILAGGTWVVPELTQGAVMPALLVDLGRAGLGGIRPTEGGLAVGATATYSDVAASSTVLERAPLLATVAAAITGGQQIRNQGTLAGSACYALPSSDVPACLVALDARMHLVSHRGTREVAAESFFVDAYVTDLRAGEVLTEILVPGQPVAASFGFYKLKLCQSSWPIATAACVVAVDGSGVCSSARIVLGGVAAVPTLVSGEWLVGAPLDTAALRRLALETEEAVVEPWEDVLADGEYRRSIAGVVARRALEAALADLEVTA